MMTNTKQLTEAAVDGKPTILREIELIVIHCSATRVNRDFTARDVDTAHRYLGYSRWGYHYYVRKSGRIERMSISLEEAKYGFVFCLLGSDRPIHESLAPSLINQREAIEKQFAGMSDLDFTYDDYEETRYKLIENVKNIMTEEDKHFLVSFEQGNPAWEKSAYVEFADYPSVKWKLLNLSKLRKNNPKKLEKGVELLEDVFSGK